MKRYILLIALIIFSSNAYSQKKKKDKKNPLDETSVSALKWRSVGPALTSGRISDLAINPDKPFEYYVAVSSGGVWKTSNWGLDYKPIFDNQSSYSIGCVTIDPNNTNIVWVGTGENNNQRSVAYGDGVYKSMDGGNSWKNMGLKNSEHIGNILVHPENSQIVYVSAYGPLWSKGGDRGIYKTEDGGETWNKILYIDEHTGLMKYTWILETQIFYMQLAIKEEDMFTLMLEEGLVQVCTNLRMEVKLGRKLIKDYQV